MTGQDENGEARRRRQLAWLQARLGRLRRALPLANRLSQGFAHGLMSISGAILAYVPTQLIGLREGFWSAITALAVVQTEFDATRSTARDQFTGAAIGGCIGLAVLLLTGQSLASYALAVMLSMLACWAINVASAARLAGITATILLLVPHAGSPQRMLVSRVSEVGWGVLVGVTIVWMATRLRAGLADEG